MVKTVPAQIKDCVEVRLRKVGVRCEPQQEHRRGEAETETEGRERGRRIAIQLVFWISGISLVMQGGLRRMEVWAGLWRCRVLGWVVVSFGFF